MKKLLVLFLIAVLSLSALTLAACFPPVAGSEGEGEQNTVYDLQAALDYLDSYFEDESTTTPSDYTLPATIVIGKISYEVSWTANVEGITITTKDDGKAYIDLNEKTPVEIKYTLTATIKAGDGTTKTYTRECTIPKYEIASHAQFLAAEKGATMTVEGTIVMINSIDKGNKYQRITLVDADGVSGYYCHNLNKDPIKDLGLKVGMKVTVTGTTDDYNGMRQLSKCDVKIVDSTTKTITPVDITNAFKNNEDLGKYVGNAIVINGVTIGSQELDVANSQYLFFELNGRKGYVRTYVTDLPHDMSHATTDNADKNKIDTEHAAKFGWTANVTGVLVRFNDSFYIVPQTTTPFTYLELVEKTPAEKIEAELEAIKLPSAVTEDGVVELPVAGKYFDDVTFAWTVDNTNFTIGEDGKVTVKLGEEAVTLTFTLTLTCGEGTDAVTETKTYTVKVSAAATDIYVPEVTTPVVDKAFKLVMFQNKLGKTLYFVGTVADKDWYLATSENVNDAVDVYLEAVEGVEGGYRLYFYAGETKTYIRVFERTASETAGKGSGSLALVTTVPTEYYTYDATLKTLVVTAPNGLSKYYLGTYNENSTFGASNTSYITETNLGTTQFPSALATLAPAAYDTVVKAPEVDKAFKLVMFQNKLGKTLYFVGTVADKDWYLATSENLNDAVDVYLEAVEGVEGGYRLYFYAGETKTYIRVFERTASETAGKGSGSLALVTTVPTEYYTYDATLKTLVVTAPNGLSKYYLGTYNENSTFGASNTSYITETNLGTTQFPSALAVFEAKKVAPKPQTPTADKAFKLVMFQNKLGKIFYFAGTTADKDWYLATTEKISQAVDVYLEAVEGVEGGYRLYFYAGETKTYIRVFERTASETAGKGSGSLALVTTVPTEYYTYDATLKTLVVTAPNGLSKYYLGTYSENSTFGASNTSYITETNLGTTQFPSALATIEFVDAHTHVFADATCTAPKTCECGATEGEALGHNIENKVCTGCGAQVVTVTEAAALADGTLVFIEATVSKITYAWSDSSKNMSVDITDGTTTLNAYKLATKVGAGDVVVIYGKVSSFNSKKQIAAGATAEIKTAHTCTTYTEGKCPVCGALDPAGATQKVTLAYTNTTTSTNMNGENQAATLGLDASLFTVTGAKGSNNNNIGLNKSCELRMYGGFDDDKNGNELSVSVASTHVIKKIKITFSGASYAGNCKVLVGENAVVTTDGNNVTVEVDINAASFILKNVNVKVNGTLVQVRIKSIEITYEAVTA